MSEQSTDGHPAVDTLADLGAGLLDERTSDGLRTHVDGCARCAEVEDRLAVVRAQLAALPPVPMPPTVAARIDTALRRAAPSKAAASGATRGRPAASGTVLPLPDRHRRPGRFTMPAGAVAAGVALLLAGAVGFGALRSGETNHTSSATAGRKAAGAPGAIAPAHPVASGRNYSATTLVTGVRALVTTSAAADSRGRAADGSSSPGLTSLPADAALGRLRQPAALQACVTELAGQPGVRPLAVDYARFQGAPAVIIVLPDRDPAKVQAWVVGPNCAASQADLKRYAVVRLAG